MFIWKNGSTHRSGFFSYSNAIYCMSAVKIPQYDGVIESSNDLA